MINSARGFLSHVFAIVFALSSCSLRAQPTAPAITLQPRAQSVSLGANVTFRVTETGSPPPTYQWRWNDATLDAATNNILVLTNIVVTQAGGYSAVVFNDSGSVTSTVARLMVDPTFTKITTGTIATDG